MKLNKLQQQRVIETIKNILLKKKELVKPSFRWNLSHFENTIKENHFVNDKQWNEFVRIAKEGI